jgi:hypothetical protein
MNRPQRRKCFNEYKKNQPLICDWGRGYFSPLPTELLLMVFQHWNMDRDTLLIRKDFNEIIIEVLNKRAGMAFQRDVILRDNINLWRNKILPHLSVWQRITIALNKLHTHHSARTGITRTYRSFYGTGKSIYFKKQKYPNLLFIYHLYSDSSPRICIKKGKAIGNNLANRDDVQLPIIYDNFIQHVSFSLEFGTLSGNILISSDIIAFSSISGCPVSFLCSKIVGHASGIYLIDELPTGNYYWFKKYYKLLYMGIIYFQKMKSCIKKLKKQYEVKTFKEALQLAVFDTFEEIDGIYIDYYSSPYDS